MAETEIDRVKIELRKKDFRHFLEHRGFVLKEGKSWNSEKGSGVVYEGKHANHLYEGHGMVLSVTKNPDGTWIGSDFKNGFEKTDIIAVYRRMHPCRFVEALKNLAEEFSIKNKLGKGSTKYKPAFKERPVKTLKSVDWPDPANFQEIQKQVAAMVPCLGHNWLENTRKISRETLAHKRFRGKILEDNYNLAFPHVCLDESEKWFVSGFERRIFYKDEVNSGFAGGGRRGFWFSNATAEDRKIIIFESALNALAYFQIHQDDICHASIGGNLAGLQKALIRRLIAKGKRLILAFDNDKSGLGYAKEIEGYSHIRGQVKRAFPPADYSDWNDVLREKKKCGSE